MAAPGGFFGRPERRQAMTIVIPEELVPLLRDGLYFDLHGQLEEASGLIEPRNRADISATGVAGCLARAEGARALLDVVGWIDPIEAATDVEVDVRRHHDALLRALLTRIATEHSVEEDPEVSDEDRDREGPYQPAR
ncbi:MAG TPA: hypothetical protein VG147_04390 [Solirubrobacteraceae bacterium]|jgi:hypothetical protein|nr:hypothetical protein [Solirubrobacteraceae bacterium]